MSLLQSEFESLIERARIGDDASVERLLALHRARLRGLVDARLDDRLRSRIDPSDVIQETLLVAADRLPLYCTDRPLPFYPWLRQIALDQLAETYRRHVKVQKRSVNREEPGVLIADHSVDCLVERIGAAQASPVTELLRQELRRKMREALLALSQIDRELIVMRYLEQMPLAEIAASLELSESATKSRHVRALKKLAAIVTESEGAR